MLVDLNQPLEPTCRRDPLLDLNEPFLQEDPPPIQQKDEIEQELAEVETTSWKELEEPVQSAGLNKQIHEQDASADIDIVIEEDDLDNMCDVYTNHGSIVYEEQEQDESAQTEIMTEDGLFDELDVYADHVDIIFEEEELNDSDEQEDDMEHDVHVENHSNGHPTKRTWLTDDERLAIYTAVLQKRATQRLKRNINKNVANMFGISVKLVQSICRKAKQCQAAGLPVDLRSKKSNCGRPRVELDLSRVPSLPHGRRGSIRALAHELQISRCKLHREVKRGGLRRHSNAIKTTLKEENRRSQLQFCVGMLNGASLANEPTFNDMYEIVHLDEKWFNATKKEQIIYVTPGEDEIVRTTHNKNSIEKVMFLAALARPRYDEEGNCTFDGKIGVWPFVKKEPALRRSRNRERGTLVTKPIIVNREISREFLIGKVVPAIAESWPIEDAGKTIWIQQDNARTHVPINDAAFANAVAQTGLDIRLMNQPPNSPDMNILDLGFFASLQSLTYRKNAKNIDCLISNVEEEFADYDVAKVNRVFLTLQSCLIEVMKVNGRNGYKIPHMNKEGMELNGILPVSLACDRSIYERVVQYLGQ